MLINILLGLRSGFWPVAGSGAFRPHMCAPPEAFEAERVVRLQVLLEQMMHAGLLALPQEPQSSHVSRRRVAKARHAAQ